MISSFEIKRGSSQFKAERDVPIIQDRVQGEYITRGYISKKLGMGVTQFRRNQRKGIFPAETCRSLCLEPLFTVKQTEAIIYAYRQWKAGKLKRSELRACIDQNS